MARVGLDQGFAARDLAQLLDQAAYWQAHLPQLQQIRQGLRARLQDLEPQQADIVARSVAMGMRQAWARWCQGQEPVDLRVSYEDLGLAALWPLFCNSEPCTARMAMPRSAKIL